MSKVPDHLKKFLINKLRRISIWWPEKAVAMNKVKVILEIGKTKKNKPIKRVFFKCDSCKGLFPRSEIEMNHIEAVIDPEKGFTDWNDFMERLFCDADGFSAECKKCHDKITKSQNKIRNLVKK